MRKVLLALVIGLLAGHFSTAARAETVTVAMFGDSLTQGYGLVQSEGLVPQLQAWLDARGADARLINAGVSGDTTAGGLARIGWTLTGEVDAVVVALGGNDMLRGIDPAVSRANLDGILDAADRAGVGVLLMGMKAPGNFGPDYKAAFDGMYPDLARAHGVALHPNLLGGIGRAVGGDATRLRQYFQGDNIHPNAAGVAVIVEDIGPAVFDLTRELRR
ncbi:arylesterase [Pukyongiella litopenaei]|uniref:Arylesterase n=1 Tax=Pukyongiella litopenaei TaxID=2605946 RepID=A0A2S0MP44_9RHOB|nr:arylesterase [Pukyongiella litopenaei]AVO37616.1 arylesterase [Pukyongiella litopenaei]